MIRRVPKLESLFVATFVLFAFRLGVRPIGDNSMLTHIRTGIDMVHRGGIPRTDPYSWTAHGVRWVVQSWLPEFSYGWAQRVGGYRLIVFEQALLMAGLAWLVVRLARAGSPLRTGLSGLIVMGMSVSFWTPRPLLFGLVCMALTVTIVEHRRTSWWLVPVVWLWVQSHGSFPLGLAWLGARAVGEGLDWRSWPRDAMSYVGAFAAGLVVSVVNPLGARLLSFPLTVGDKREAFQSIIEWRSPDFQHGGPRIALVFMTLALLLLVRARLPWRDVVPVVLFFALALVAVRNFPLTAIVLAPVLGRVLRRPESAPARPAPLASQDRMNRALALTLGLAFVLFGTSTLSGTGLSLHDYPKAAVTYLDEQGLLSTSHRLAHEDFVGNYLELRYGSAVQVFVDDRYDMYPLAVSRDYRRLLGAREQSLGILDQRAVDVVLWDKDEPLTNLLRVSGRWEQVWAEGNWVIFRRMD
ncbi:MAG TPA: hypothetical protein VL337_09930 [Acidimicrobiales bacterium]|nr:hypothetical protein [Acidimicrobiales bacterium]